MPGKEIEIDIRVEAELSESLGSEFWDVIDVVDESTGLGLGDIGIADFNAYSDFPGTITEAVIKHLAHYDPFEDEAFYSIRVKIYDGGSLLGQAFQHFHGKEMKKVLAEHSDHSE